MQEEARQTFRDISRAFEGDNAATAKEADEIDITVNNGAVILKGTVTSTGTKSEMARIARKESGVTKVADEIKIAERVGAGSGD